MELVCFVCLFKEVIIDSFLEILFSSLKSFYDVGQVLLHQKQLPNSVFEIIKCCHRVSPCWCEIIVKVWSSTSSRVCFLLHCWNFRIFQKMQLYWPTNAKQNANWSSKYFFWSNSVLSLSLAGCTFEEDSDPSLCEYRQAQEDDFDWQLVRTYSWPHMTSDLIRGEFFFLCCNKHIWLYYHSSHVYLYVKWLNL